MARYRFQFGDVDGRPGEMIESEHTSDDDAMCDAARTVAEMLKEQAQSAGGPRGFAIVLTHVDGQSVGTIRVTVTGPSAGL